MATLTEKMPLVATDAALDRAITERIDRLLDQRLEAKLAELKAAKTPSISPQVKARSSIRLVQFSS